MSRAHLIATLVEQDDGRHVVEYVSVYSGGPWDLTHTGNPAACYAELAQVDGESFEDAVVEVVAGALRFPPLRWIEPFLEKSIQKRLFDEARKRARP